jgi:hypothetical protein
MSFNLTSNDSYYDPGFASVAGEKVAFGDPESEYADGYRFGPFAGTVPHATAGFAGSIMESLSTNWGYNAQGTLPFYADVPVGQNKEGGGELPRSLINEYALFQFRGLYGDLGTNPATEFFNFADGIHGKSTAPQKINGGDYAKNATLSRIIQWFLERYPGIGYNPQDFLYNKYYNKIPVNHLITLRRFPMPCYDNIYNLKHKSAVKDGDGNYDGTAYDAPNKAGVTATTYLGEKAGNKLEDLLKYTYGLNFKELTTDMEKYSTGDKGYTAQPFYSKITGVGRAFADTLKGQKGGKVPKEYRNTTDDGLSTTHPNFVLGPVNVVNQTWIRDRGLKFSNDITLSFEYSLKSLSYVNPKIAMIDVMANMMTMTYNNAQFFGGGSRFYGAAGYVGSQFGDINQLKQGNFGGYVKSIVKDVRGGMENSFGLKKGGTVDWKKFVQGAMKMGGNLLGNMLGSFLGGSVGGASGTFATKAQISGEPTGDWHVTIGNPLNPIVMMGNMICDETTMTLGSGLGADDFPVEVKFDVNLKHGKPRDKGDIENMFNMGKGRIYAAPEDGKDFLNLKGLNIETYGSIAGVGKSHLEGGQSNINWDDQTGKIDKQDVPVSNGCGSIYTAFDVGNPNYLKNLIKMTNG